SRWATNPESPSFSKTSKNWEGTSEGPRPSARAPQAQAARNKSSLCHRAQLRYRSGGFGLRRLKLVFPNAHAHACRNQKFESQLLNEGNSDHSKGGSGGRCRRPGCKPNAAAHCLSLHRSKHPRRVKSNRKGASRKTARSCSTSIESRPWFGRIGVRHRLRTWPDDPH